MADPGPATNTLTPTPTPTPSPALFADEYPFDLDGGRLCLDFANSLGLSSSDHLRSLVDLIGFCRQSGILADDTAHHLRTRAARAPAAADALLARAKLLRAALFRIFAAVVRRESPSPTDLDLLNAELAEALANQQLVVDGGRFAWEWRGGLTEPRHLLWPVVRSAADLLLSEDRLGIRECAASDCAWLFLDTSRNRSRQWCSMRTCGNRAKARRHHERRRRADSPSRTASATNTGSAS